MGLDMVLVLKNRQHATEDEYTADEILYTVDDVFTEYAYYRKFNALEGYFVENYNHENGGTVPITREMIDEIYDLMNEIRFNRDKASELLPTFPGPFFGSYDYDRIYHQYVDQACMDFYHAKFLDFDKYELLYTSNW